ncbi:MAG: HD domain-containing protein [Victivallales bacterium]|nr:HD domain-containing protein [Victivallales bacterium]
MKPRPAKANPPESAPQESVSEAVSAPEPSSLPPVETTETLTPGQLQELRSQRVQRDIQVKTKACLNRNARELRKSYRVAWRKYWPLLPLLLATWLVGAFCLMPRHFNPADASRQKLAEGERHPAAEFTAPSATTIQYSENAPFLGQEPTPHLNYHDSASEWPNFSLPNFLHALRSRSFWVAALILLAFLATYSYVIYLVQVNQPVEVRRYVLLSLLLCLEFLAVFGCANFITNQFEVPLPILLSCLPLAFFPAIICNLLNKRLAYVTATLMAVLLPLQLNLPSEHFPLFYFSLLAILSAVFIFRDIAKRLEFLSRGLYFGFMLAVAEFLFALSQGALPAGKDFLIAVVFLLAGGIANGLFNGSLCFLMMPFLEVCFRLPTAPRLAEISNLDEPLLERLRTEAPGTYEHSIAVADLAVAAAKTIGANAKLAYAMALYHDIGKLFSPAHFTENLQDGEATPHLRHSPEDSCEYLREHARFGLRLARKYHLPSLIYPAILQHHGNTIMASFYQQACRQASEKHLPAPDQERFRYDQQPPSSREVALIMLADSCEAATRSITHRKRDSKGEAQLLTAAEEKLRQENPAATPQELAALYEKLLNEQEATAQANFREQIAARVKSVIQGKFTDGQFDRVDLTTRQLAQLADSFVATLLDKNHTRLEYKK